MTQRSAPRKPVSVPPAQDAIRLAEACSNDPRSDLYDRLEMARMVGALRALDTGTKAFTTAAIGVIRLAGDGKVPEAREVLTQLKQVEGLDPVTIGVQMAMNPARALRFEELALPSANRKNLGVILMKVTGQDTLLGAGKADAASLLRYA